ncbi:MAG: hypothetical protein HFE78_00700 [Clostridiales bacterium]|nr:hypothetical protein [Clostridiales bacterium]
MFESNMTVSHLIELAKDSCDIAPDIDTEYYLLWLNSLESRLYTGIIKDYQSAVCDVYAEKSEESGAGAPGMLYIQLGDIAVPANQSRPRFCDIAFVLAEEDQLTKTDAGAAAVFTDKGSFYGDGAKVRLVRARGLPETVTVVYRVRPAAKTGAADERVSLPDEFLPLALDFLTGNAYALAGEDGQAAKWLERYNAELDDLTEWLALADKKFEGVVK